MYLFHIPLIAPVIMYHLVDDSPILHSSYISVINEHICFRLSARSKHILSIKPIGDVLLAMFSVWLWQRVSLFRYGDTGLPLSFRQNLQQSHNIFFLFNSRLAMLSVKTDNEQPRIRVLFLQSLSNQKKHPYSQPQPSRHCPLPGIRS